MLRRFFGAKEIINRAEKNEHVRKKRNHRNVGVKQGDKFG
jgi:hypothetical protein